MSTLTKSQVVRYQKKFTEETDRLADLLDAFGDRNRLRILQLFSKQCDLCVSDIADILDISVSAASQQLKTLEMRGILKREKRGQLCCYKINQKDKLVASLIHLIN